MPVSQDKRLKIERTIAIFRDKLSQAHRSDAAWVRRYRSGDEAAIDEILQRACDESGLAHADYLDAVEADPQLLELQRKCVTEAMLGSITIKAVK